MQACVKFGAVFRNKFIILGAHPASFSIEKGFFLPTVKRLGPDVNQSPPSNAEIRNKWSYNSFLPTHLGGEDRNNFTFHLSLF
jgi:hypothetical protein